MPELRGVLQLKRKVSGKKRAVKIAHLNQHCLVIENGKVNFCPFFIAKKVVKFANRQANVPAPKQDHLSSSWTKISLAQVTVLRRFRYVFVVCCPQVMQSARDTLCIPSKSKVKGASSLRAYKSRNARYTRFTVHSSTVVTVSGGFQSVQTLIYLKVR